MKPHDSLYHGHENKPAVNIVDSIIKRCKQCLLERRHSTRNQKLCDQCRKVK